VKRDPKRPEQPVDPALLEQPDENSYRRPPPGRLITKRPEGSPAPTSAPKAEPRRGKARDPILDLVKTKADWIAVMYNELPEFPLAPEVEARILSGLSGKVPETETEFFEGLSES